jgi:molybdenum cofactor cytidylyltransferase
MRVGTASCRVLRSGTPSDLRALAVTSNRVQKSDTRFAFGVVILAAGSSQRMGAPKLLLPWGETSVLGHLLQTWQRFGAAQIGVVCAKAIPGLQEELNRRSFSEANRIFNPTPERGMFSSIQLAAGWNGWKAELTHWVITLGDQPHLKPQTLQALLDFGKANSNRICQPQRQGRRKHPVLLPARIFSDLKDSRATHLKQFLTEHDGQVDGFESEDAGLDLDMDTPADYQRALSLSSSHR